MSARLVPELAAGRGRIAPHTAVVLLASLAALAFVVVGLMLFLFARLTGWRALAQRFPSPGPRGARSFSSGGVLLGRWGWNGPPLRIGLDDEGVVLHPLALFRLAFADVRFPWREIVSAVHREYLLFDVLEVRLGEGAPITIIGFLPSAAATAISERIAPP